MMIIVNGGALPYRWRYALVDKGKKNRPSMSAYQAREISIGYFS